MFWAASASCSAPVAVLLASTSYYLHQPPADISLVLTVDRRGCANFTSLQKAVVAVDAGVYVDASYIDGSQWAVRPLLPPMPSISAEHASTMAGIM
nr:unnamed protein product [Digitaria exilis]